MAPHVDLSGFRWFPCAFASANRISLVWEFGSGYDPARRLLAPTNQGGMLSPSVNSRYVPVAMIHA